jgi:hypothetical protein
MARFSEKMKLVWIFSLQNLFTALLDSTRIQGDIIINVLRSSLKVSDTIIPQFQISLNPSNGIRVLPSGETGVTKLINRLIFATLQKRLKISSDFLAPL